jgi:hypothetical protein
LKYGSYMALASAHHPQTDGQTEVLNSLIEQMLRAYVFADRSSWAKFLPELAFSYNSSVHTSTMKRPDELLYGYRPQMRRVVKMFEPGDQVLVNAHSLKLVETEGTGKKLVQRMIGPFEVMERINPLVYRLRLPDNYPMNPVLNMTHLRPYRPSPEQFGERTALPFTRDVTAATEENEVEAILGHRLSGRKTGNRRIYWVKWKDFDITEESIIDYIYLMPTLYLFIPLIVSFIISHIWILNLEFIFWILLLFQSTLHIYYTRSRSTRDLLTPATSPSDQQFSPSRT